MKCPYCGANQPPEAVKCEYCGMYQDYRSKPQEAPQSAPQVVYEVHNHYEQPTRSEPASQPQQVELSRNRWIALLLCLFVGPAGGHRFYVGKIGTGIMYLFTGGLFGIGSIVDFFSILLGTFRDKEGNKLRS